MSELISGKKALIALGNGKEVEYKSINSWVDASLIYAFEFLEDDREFRLKPKTITINGIEVPAPFDPKEGEHFFYLDDGEECGYISCIHDWGFDPLELNFGAWRTKEEIEQVVAALRKVFKGESRDD